MNKIAFFSTIILALPVLFISCSGDDGEQGPQGLQGEQGVQGEQGEQGLPGEDSPNVDFYFQDGFKNYAGTQDVSITPDGSYKDNMLYLSYIPNDANNTSHSLMRFDYISETITSALVGATETCSDAFYVNRAILYLYVPDYGAENIFPLYFHFGFYNAADPLFAELDANWADANQVDQWFAPGAESSEWAGPFPGTDNYSVMYPVTGTPDTYPGWVALLLPRNIVNSWICDENANKGFRLRLSHSGVTFAHTVFISSDDLGAPELRPLLVIETEKNNGSTAKVSTNKNKEQDWESLTNEEKMAPLQRFLEARKAN